MDTIVPKTACCYSEHALLSIVSIPFTALRVIFRPMLVCGGRGCTGENELLPPASLMILSEVAVWI